MRAPRGSPLPMLKCDHCGVSYCSTYRMNATRLAKPKYCTAACFHAMRREVAASAVAVRFWSKVDRRGPNACWPWLGASRSHWGYGRIHIGGRVEHANRVAYALAHGQVPRGAFVCHSCDNPLCCNPAHLWLGDALTNTQDMDAKGRRKSTNLRGDAHPGRKLNSDSVREIRRLRASDREAAAMFNVTPQQIRNIRNRKHWRHVE